MMMMRGPRWLKVAKVLVVVAIAVAVFGYAVMSLWNWLVPGLVGWHTLSFAQAVGVLILCRLLFGGFGRHGGHWRHRAMQARYESLSPEERERLRESCGAHCRDR